MDTLVNFGHLPDGKEGTCQLLVKELFYFPGVQSKTGGWQMSLGLSGKNDDKDKFFTCTGQCLICDPELGKVTLSNLWNRNGSFSFHGSSILDHVLT